MTTTNTSVDECRAARYEQERLHRRSSIQKIINSSSYASPGFIVAMSLALMAAIVILGAGIQMAQAFVVQPMATRRPSTKIFLEDWVANLIDNEVYRQDHHSEYEAAWMEKNKGAVLSRLSDAGDGGGANPSQLMLGDESFVALAEHKRDERMAFLKPEQYCADRCVATGNCDILEEFYELGPQDVIKFCEECVLNFDEVDDEGGSECEVPEAFYEKEPPLRP